MLKEKGGRPDPELQGDLVYKAVLLVLGQGT